MWPRACLPTLNKCVCTYHHWRNSHDGNMAQPTQQPLTSHFQTLMHDGVNHRRTDMLIPMVNVLSVPMFRFMLVVNFPTLSVFAHSAARSQDQAKLGEVFACCATTSACPLGVRPNGITINTNSAPVTVATHEMVLVAVLFSSGCHDMLRCASKAKVAIYYGVIVDAKQFGCCKLHMVSDTRYQVLSRDSASLTYHMHTTQHSGSQCKAGMTDDIHCHNRFH